MTINAVSVMLACSHMFRSILGEILKDKMPALGAQQSGKMDATSAANSLASLLHGPLGNALHTHSRVTEALTPYKNATDLTGLNYMPARYELEKKLCPDRLVLGTEEYPSDIVRLWGLVEKYPHVIGDMTWTGWDYLGEAGIGIYYYDGTLNFMPHWPDRAAYIGDINMLGYRRPVSFWREIVYGLRKEPYIAVSRMEYNNQQASQSSWMVKDQISSWTWRGFEGEMAEVDVFSDAPQVELVLNGRSLGIQPAGREKGFVASFNVPYERGRLEAWAVRDGSRAECYVLQTADDQIFLTAESGSSLTLHPDEVVFIPVDLCDANGQMNLQTKKNVTAAVNGEAALLAFGSAAPSSSNSYDDSICETWDGQVMAAVRAGRKAGSAQIVFTAPDCQECIVEIQVKD